VSAEYWFVVWAGVLPNNPQATVNKSAGKEPRYIGLWSPNLIDVGKALKKHLSVAGPRFFFRFCRNTPNYISLARFHQKRCAALDTH
jgi:hypothetical protein